MTWNPEFEVAFNPKAVAVVGASRKTLPFSDFVGILQNAGFPGRIYPINPSAVGQKIHGLKVYPNLVSVPEPIDLVTVSVPAHAVPSVLEDCIAANAKSIQIYTAGFKESGEEKGIALEEKLQEIARRGGLRIVGPNCMGLHVPTNKLTTWVNFDPQPGPVAFLTQSGGHAGVFIIEAPDYGIRVSKVISYGNAAVLDSIDFLEYLATDPETQIICIYLEGVSDGRRLTTLVREINKTKPVIVWKGGATECGARAAASHTGSLGGEREVWDAFFKQTGAVRVNSLEELLNVTMTFRYLRTPAGNRVALVGGGGGNSVAAADVCDRAGLDVPPFSEKTRQELLSFVPLEGTILKNPIDIAFAMLDLNVLVRAMETAAADPSIDAIIFVLPPVVIFLTAGILQSKEKCTFEEAMEKQSRLVVDSLTRFDRENTSGKPLAIVLQPGLIRFRTGQREQLRQELLKSGMPVYLSIEQASRALVKFLRYHEFALHKPL